MTQAPCLVETLNPEKSLGLVHGALLQDPPSQDQKYAVGSCSKCLSPNWP